MLEGRRAGTSVRVCAHHRVCICTQCIKQSSPIVKKNSPNDQLCPTNHQGCLFSAAEPFVDRLSDIAEGRAPPEPLEELEARLDAAQASKKSRDRKKVAAAERMDVDDDDDPFLYSDGEDAGELGKLSAVAQGVHVKAHLGGVAA